MRYDVIRCLVAASFTFAAVPTWAVTIVVPPGPGTPVQDAIDAAAPGDIVMLQSASEYHEAIVITKAIGLVGDKKTVFGLPQDSSTIDADCANPVAIVIAADGVSIQGVRVQGATDTAIDVVGHSRIKIRKVFPIANCLTEAVTGIHVAQSTNVKVEDNILRAPGGTTDDTGIHIEDVVTRANIKVSKNMITEQVRGLAIEGAAPKAVTASGNFVNGNRGIGISLLDSRGIRIKSNQALSNGDTGIAIDAASSNNVISRNEATGNTVVDVSDSGTGNCWRNNTFGTGTVPSCP